MRSGKCHFKTWNFFALGSNQVLQHLAKSKKVIIKVIINQCVINKHLVTQVPMGAFHVQQMTWCALNFEPLIPVHPLLLSLHSATLFMVSSGSKNLVPWLFHERYQWFSSQGNPSLCAFMKASLCRRVWQPYTCIIKSVLHSARSSKKGKNSAIITLISHGLPSLLVLPS